MIFLKTVTIFAGVVGVTNLNVSDMVIPGSIDDCRDYLAAAAHVKSTDDVIKTVEWDGEDRMTITASFGKQSASQVIRQCIDTSKK